MTRFDKYRYHGLHTCRVKPKEGDDVTRQGLAYTPADMERMLAQGLPINSANMAAEFYDGDDTNEIVITSDRDPSKDINDLWEEDIELREKMKRVYHASKKSKSD